MENREVPTIVRVPMELEIFSNLEDLMMGQCFGAGKEVSMGNREGFWGGREGIVEASVVFLGQLEGSHNLELLEFGF